MLDAAAMISIGCYLLAALLLAIGLLIEELLRDG